MRTSTPKWCGPRDDEKHLADSDGSSTRLWSPAVLSVLGGLLPLAWYVERANLSTAYASDVAALTERETVPSVVVVNPDRAEESRLSAR